MRRECQMKRRLLAVLAALSLALVVGAGPVFARADSTVTETCTNGTVTVYTTVDGSSVNPGNFDIGSANFANNTPLGYTCWIS
jgi:hypothetical protein